MRVRQRLIVFVALNCIILPLAGQAAEARPFGRVELALAAVAAGGAGGALQRYWDPELGFELTASTPFYAGILQLGAQQAHIDARRPDVPGFRGRLLFVGWGGELPVARGLTLGGGVRLGMYEMRFDGDTIPDFRRDESELGMALRSTAAYAVGGRWRLHAAAAYQVVYTREHVEQLLFSAGVGRTFPMPAWLRDFVD